MRFACLAATVYFCALAVAAAQTNWAWSDGFAPAFGCDGRVWAVERMDSGLMYFGGDFNACGDVAAANLVRFDPASGEFSAVMMDEVNGVSGVVRALASNGNDLYVGGDFTHAGTTLVNRLVRFDGQQWQAIGSAGSVGVGGGSVMTLVFHEGLLYAGGTFTSAGGVPLNRVGRWDGSSWNDMGGGMDTAPLSTVNKMVVHPQAPLRLYATGSFTEAGAQTVNNVARWDGNNWHPMTDSQGGIGLNQQGRVVALDGDDVIVGGSFTEAGGKAIARVARFDGTAWSGLGSGVNGPVFALTVDAGRVVVGGGFTFGGNVLAHGLAMFEAGDWQAFTDLEVGIRGTPYELLFIDGELLVAGDITAAGGCRAQSLARWNGERFFSLSEIEGWGTRGRVFALARFNGELIATGLFRLAGAVDANHIARFDGQQWHPLGTGLNTVGHVLLAHEGMLYVGGNFSGQPGTRVARWDGNTWQSLGEGLNGVVHALVWHDGALHAAGAFTLSGTTPVNRVARFDGAAWQALGEGTGNGIGGTVYSLASFQGELIAGGLFLQAGGQPAARIARWDGSQWLPFGSGASSVVRAMTVHQGALIVGGSFVSVDGVTTGPIARFDGTSWTALSDTPLPGQINALASSNDQWLFAAGEFATALGETSPNLAWLNGSDWIRIGDSTGHGAAWEIRSVITQDDADPNEPPVLYVGGRFGQGGLFTAANMGRLVPLGDRIFRDGFSPDP